MKSYVDGLMCQITWNYVQQSVKNIQFSWNNNMSMKSFPPFNMTNNKLSQRLEKLTNRLWPNLKNFNVDYRFVHIFRFLFYAHICRSVSYSQWLQVIYNSCYENYIKCFQFRTFIGNHNCIQLIWKFIISEWIKSTIVRRNTIMYA